MNSYPASLAFAITPSNSADFSYPTRGIWVGGAGDLTVDMAGSGTNITIPSIPAGTFLPICVRRVYVTGTDATDLVGFA